MASFLILLLCLHGSFAAFPRIQPFINQTSNGTYTLYSLGGVQGNKAVFNSVWYQDDINKRLMLSVGIRGVLPWRQAFWFFKNTTYEVSSTSNTDPTQEACIEVPDFNYTMEIKAYDHTYLTYLAPLITEENGKNVTLQAYAGQALDGVGPLNVVASVDDQGLYAKLAVIGGIGSFHYGEYHLFNRNGNLPPNHVFQIPDSCKQAKKEYFFQKYNSLGQRLMTNMVCSSSHRFSSVPMMLPFVLAVALLMSQ